MALVSAADDLVDRASGRVSRRIFFDPEIYRIELERVFYRSWLFLAHESQIALPGDFITTYMGEDPIIVCRDVHGRVRAFLNSCRHRGMRVCRYDSGNARQFRCSFHGWTYSNEGDLVGVPHHKSAYGDLLDWKTHGLHEVPHVASHAGFIFGCWDETAPSLDVYLGDMRWYFDIIALRCPGGIEVLEGQQRYACHANWKIAAENFSGDTYHLGYSHKSLFMLDNVRQFNPVGYDSKDKTYTVTFPEGHALTAVGVDGERYRADMRLAQEMGPEVVEFVEENRRRLAEYASEAQARVYGVGFGNVFPNFSFNDFSALRPIGIYLWLPRGPGQIEAWQWCGVAKDAPQSVKTIVREDFSRIQSAVGIAGQDDTENFEQVTEATRGVVGQSLDFNYQIGLEDEPGQRFDGIPGDYFPYISEAGQRNFYRRWAEMIEHSSPEKTHA